MEKDFVLLAHLWQRRGFMSMPKDFQEVLFRALQSTPQEEQVGNPGPIENLYIEKCEKWIRRSELDSDAIDWFVVRRERDSLISKWQYHQLTVSDIEWNLANPQEFRIHDVERFWCWSWYPYAFGVFWAMFYHIENEYLKRPNLIWETVLEQIHRWYTLLPDKKSFSFEYVSALLALYERLLGMHYDQKAELVHYRMNIQYRTELRDAEQKERVEAFREAVRILLENVRREICVISSKSVI